MSESFSHVSVLLSECIEGLAIKPGGIYVDCTAGGGGHSFEIASRLGEGGRLISIDQDADAIAACTKRLSPHGEKCTVVQANFSHLSDVLADLGIDRVDGVLADLGVSSYQLDTAERGFSYMADAPLDMRMNREGGKSAYDVVNTYSQQRLKEILWLYGEEKFSGRIAQRIVSERETAPIETTLQLAEIIRSAMPGGGHGERQHPAKRTFQAIRIEVNGELDVIEPVIEQAYEHLNPGGRIAVITFHSLEDRLVKNKFAEYATGCTCPPDFPVCVCGKTPRMKVITKKPILPGEEELACNPRSRSAKLRIAEKR